MQNMQPTKSGFLGFPPPHLGEESIKLSAWAQPGKWIAVEKPQDVSVRPDPDSRKDPKSIERALQARALEELPSWREWGMHSEYRPKSIFSIDSAIHGFGLWALNDTSLAELRNAYGSDHFSFTYEFLSRDHPDSGSEFSVNLPIAQHLQDPSRYVISTTTGKKSETEYVKLKSWSRAGVALWKATTTRARGHQIRLHAFECGLQILGENVYSTDPGVSLLDLKKRRISKHKEAASPLWPGINVRLCALEHADFKIEFPIPSAMSTLIRKLDQFAS